MSTAESPPVARLWEIVHPYRCEPAENCADYSTWDEYVETDDNSDLDMNLLFRWDWLQASDKMSYTPGIDPTERDGLLRLFFMLQRRAYFATVEVEVCQNDEPAVRAWLATRWAFMQNLWSPVAGTPVVQKIDVMKAEDVLRVVAELTRKIDAVRPNAPGVLVESAAGGSEEGVSFQDMKEEVAKSLRDHFGPAFQGFGERLAQTAAKFLEQLETSKVVYPTMDLSVDRIEKDGTIRCLFRTDNPDVIERLRTNGLLSVALPNGSVKTSPRPSVEPMDEISPADAEAMLKRLTAHYRDPVMPLGRFCSAMKTWAGAIKAGVEQAKAREKYGQQGWMYAAALDHILRDIKKSNLLNRLLFRGEEFRTVPCPMHNGHWDGQVMNSAVCPHQCDGTGWLRAAPPVTPEPTSSAKEPANPFGSHSVPTWSAHPWNKK